MQVRKLVVLKLGLGNFEQGFPVTLQIGEDGASHETQISGNLPPAPEIPQHYKFWQSLYRRIDKIRGLKAPKVQLTNLSNSEEFQEAVERVRTSLNTGLNSETFRPIREKLLEQLTPSDNVRFLLETEDILLQRLPWHLWDFFDRYTHADLAISAPSYHRTQKKAIHSRTLVNILAILGNSEGINIKADLELLQQLPNAALKFLVEPSRQDINDEIWQNPCDIIFFAGHSKTQEASGVLYINKTDSLSVKELKYALRQAIKGGLQLAIFNSCDGLGLARDLAKLDIPQIIVMREPVPDRVAQEFLKSFLQEYANGESLYLAVRQARERLQGLETEFPCATWLPVIFQNPAEIPPTWEQLRTAGRSRFKPVQILVRRVLVASLLITGLVLGMRYLKLLQPYELQAFDQLVRLRPPEPEDPRLLVVEVTEADIEAQDPKTRTGSTSLSDAALAALLEKLDRSSPRVIGLDIYRAFPASKAKAALATRLRYDSRFIAICSHSNVETKYPGLKAPPEVPSDRLGFNDAPIDDDGIVRRYLWSMTENTDSPCKTNLSFGSQLALRYLVGERDLVAKGYLKETTAGWELINPQLKPLGSYAGGYQGLDNRGFQILLNYRQRQNVAPTLTLKQVLSDRFDPNLVKDRIVLIGVTAESAKDFFYTPYSINRHPTQAMPGVFVHAQMVSQIISAVKDGLPLLGVWSYWGEAIWIWGWAAIGGIIAVSIRGKLLLGVVVAIASGVLGSLCFVLLLTQGSWVPLVPSALALIGTSASLMVYNTRQDIS